MDDPNKPQEPDKKLEISETSGQPEAHPQDEPVSESQSDDEAAQRHEDSAKADQIRQELGVDEPENPDLGKTPAQLFDTILKPRIHEVIESWGLVPVIEKCKYDLGRLPPDIDKRKRAKHEKKAVMRILRHFEKPIIPFIMKMKIPLKKWSFFPDAMSDEKAANCSGAALIFGSIMNDKLGIKTEHVNPMGHAANFVTYSDGSTQFVDPRDAYRKSIKLGSPREERDGFRIYELNDRNLEYSLLPVSEFKHGAMLTMFENVCSLDQERENDAKADLTADFYKDSLDFDFAKQYMKGNFLTVRDAEEEWIRERKRIVSERRRIDAESLLAHPPVR